MNIWDIILGAAIAAAFLLAVRKIIRDHKNGKHCCGDCANCSRHCGR